MKIFIILYLSLSLMSCIAKDGKNSSSREREKTETRPRQRTDKKSSSETQTETQNNPRENSQSASDKNQAEDQNKNFIFPVEITDDLESLKIESSDNKRLHISAIGGDMFLLAPQTGSLSIKTLKDFYHLEILIPKERKLNLLLEKSKTILQISSPSQVIQRQPIAQTSGAAVFYISKDSKELILCLGDILGDTKAGISIIKSSNIETCN